MKINRYKTKLLVCATISLLGCSDGWLETKPLSIYTPEIHMLMLLGLNLLWGHVCGIL